MDFLTLEFPFIVARNVIAGTGAVTAVCVGLRLAFGLPPFGKRFTYDLMAYWITFPFIAAMVGISFVLTVRALTDNWAPFALGTYPLWLQIPILLLGHEFLTYWLHRAAHRYDFMFRLLHAQHHDEDEIPGFADWTTGTRDYLASFLLGIFVYASLMLVSGASVAAFMGLHVLLFATAISHFPVPFSFGPFDAVFLSPKGHMLHHTGERRQFGLRLTLFDTIFSTYRSPKEHGRNT